ncbi:alpha-crystallin B chain-like [Babylonia areolata]|uniref:alpha-crystallin B chain-like n=1 Tax=Babylonia areolata TaxID=304850 RepID=UPI003FD23825
MALNALLRGFWDDPWERLREPSLLFDQHFGNLVPDDFYSPGAIGYPSRCVACPGHGGHHQLHHRVRAPPPRETGVSEVANTDKEFRINMDMRQFRPEEIHIKTKEKRLIISARHEERPDEHGFIAREFTRQYVLPKDVDPDTVTSSLSRDGVLTLKAPKKAIEASQERSIPITHETEVQEEQSEQ